VAQVRRALEIDPALRVLGDGANLLVDDEGVEELVVKLDPRGGIEGNELGRVEWDASGAVRAGAGANLPAMITEAVRRGLGGIEGLAGVPASLGGALVMNAGGAFGQIADVVVAVEGIDRAGRAVRLERGQIAFGYRASGLEGLVITGAELRLTPGDKDALRARLKEVMDKKKGSQPLRENSAGCVFKNPVLDRDVEGVGGRGQRVSAGMLIDRAGLKGLRAGGASVSEVHANFVVTGDGARARDVIDLIGEVRRRVLDRFGVTLATEVVIWRRSPA
jgi:UDP-N-acetylmuramate dehydrogenase